MPPLTAYMRVLIFALVVVSPESELWAAVVTYESLKCCWHSCWLRRTIIKRGCTGKEETRSFVYFLTPACKLSVAIMRNVFLHVNSQPYSGLGVPVISTYVVFPPIPLPYCDEAHRQTESMLSQQQELVRTQIPFALAAKAEGTEIRIDTEQIHYDMEASRPNQTSDRDEFKKYTRKVGGHELEPVWTIERRSYQVSLQCCRNFRPGMRPQNIAPPRDELQAKNPGIANLIATCATFVRMPHRSQV